MSEYDPDLDFHESQSPMVIDELDPLKVQHYVDLCRTRQRLMFAMIFGLVAALLSSLMWIGMRVTTGHQIGWMAIAIGVVTGVTVRWTGRGIDTSFGMAAAWLALLGCLLGDLFAGIFTVASQIEDVTAIDLIKNMTPDLLGRIYREALTAITIVYYFVCCAAAFKLAIRKIGRTELMQYINFDESAADATRRTIGQRGM